MRRLSSGYWESPSGEWRYVNLGTGEMWQRADDGRYVTWTRETHNITRLRETIAIMRYTGWVLADRTIMGDDDYTTMLADIYAPDGLDRRGGTMLTDTDRRDGWTYDNGLIKGYDCLDTYRDPTYRLDLGMVCEAAFLGCAPGDVDDVLAYVDGIPTTPRHGRHASPEPTDTTPDCHIKPRHAYANPKAIGVILSMSRRKSAMYVGVSRIDIADSTAIMVVVHKVRAPPHRVPQGATKCTTQHTTPTGSTR